MGPISVGLYIGQGINSSCLALVEMGDTNILHHLSVFDIGKYSGIKSRLMDLKYKMVTRWGRDDFSLKVNITEIGLPVVTIILSESYPHIIPVMLVGGYKERLSDNTLLLPKELMISYLKIILQENMLTASKSGLDYTDQTYVLQPINDEILKYNTNVQLNPFYWLPSGQTGEHDCQIIALGLACWRLKQ